MIFVVIHLGYKQLLLIMILPLLYTLAIFLGGKKSDIWIISSLLLLSYNFIKYRTFFWYFLEYENLHDEEVYLILFCIPWVQLRCISFCLDYVEKSKDFSKKTSKIETLIELTSYVLYVPLLYTGPVILYDDFRKSFSLPNQELSVKLKCFILDMFIFLFYTFVMDASLHYIYFYAMHSDMELVRMFPTLALCGGVLWMGLQFHMKYVIAYGTTAAFARLDKLEMPPTPRCIVRIHVYSQMWRYFDVGLYRFLVKYIYKPSSEALSERFRLPHTINKLIASFATFVFIFMWHGTIMRVFVWSVLNYLGITVEYFIKVISTTEQYKWFKKNILRTEAMETRFTAMLCVPLLHFSAISMLNFYLFAGKKIGNYYFQYFLPSVLNFNSVVIFISLYCCCIVSMALQDVPSRTDKQMHVKVNRSEMKCHSHCVID
ncbi:protein-cysteine N-palmitoyltransferase Rasp isoform X2 [Pectinophora gossypiella]|uniref:protein-cysteine N-palmitoyltransferase Rasp isoform X2 n=1 Tax=Pectinophora gossypiella TaxID=13191 RepID=UPI00214EED54|nr:protein-cysteine N-palmitoyltransferase Rasp isoform X2 [Pectinophora gossypiella]